MAEIGIERKSPTLWPWVLLLLVVLIGGWLWFEREDPVENTTAGEDAAPALGRDGQANATVTGTSGDSAPAPVLDYMRYSGVVAGATDVPEMSIAHDYSAEGLRKLAAALETTASAQKADVAQTVSRLRASADELQQDQRSLRHAALVRDAFTAAAEAIGSLSQAPDVTALKSAAAAIDPGRPLLGQRDAVRQFFRQSAEALDAVSRG
jgi:hypothetical protein